MITIYTLLLYTLSSPSLALFPVSHQMLACYTPWLAAADAAAPLAATGEKERARETRGLAHSDPDTIPVSDAKSHQ